MDKQEYYELANKVLQEVCQVVIGKDEIVAKVLMALLAKGHILLEDIPGVGKTTIAMAFSEAMGLNYNRVQFTPDVMPSDIIGFEMYNQKTGEFEYRQGAAICNLLLADEINRTSPKTQSALLQLMEEGSVTVEGKVYNLPEPFNVLATQNPYGSAGTQKLPESQMDRFMVRLSIGYPSVRDEMMILKSKEQSQKKEVHSILTAEQFIEMQRIVEDEYVDDAVYEYVAKIAKATREHEAIRQGISPRGSIALIRMAKAYAFLQGRDYVKPMDVKEVLEDVVLHRIIVSKSFHYDGQSEKKILQQVCEKVSIPLLR